MITIEIRDKENHLLYVQSDNKEVTLGGYRGLYQEGDRIKILSDQNNIYLKLLLDQSLNENIVYLKGYEYTFNIPFKDERKPYGDNAFTGERHWGYASIINGDELNNYMKLSENSYDTNCNDKLYPHASTNVKTVNPQFFPRNAIDGVFETCNHGSWPHSSWGINQQSDAWLKIDFGRKVHMKQMCFYLRADFPHDNYWISGELELSNGESIELTFYKSGKSQSIDVDLKSIEWIKLKKLIMSDEPSSFPALSQIVIYGYNEL
ncbi:MAG: hypothetical protein RR512_01145 [Coprobacillus sp.]